MSRSSADQELHSSSEYSNENINNPSSSGTTEIVVPAEKMVAPSKEAGQDNPAQFTTKKGVETSSSDSDSIFNVIYSIVKKVSMVGAIYLVGYMNWSVAWLITPLVLSVTREHWQKSSQLKRYIAKVSATANEKDVILARIKDLPAWVYFPDVERCEWVNRILQQIWPNANYYAKDLVKNVIEPKVAEALAEYKLSGFKFDRIMLGTISPRVGGVKVYDKNISRNEIILDMDLFYASDCDINFQVAGMKAGIKDFQIHGTIRVIMKPLISKIPLIGGLQIFFLNNPDIDFNLVGVADILDLPGISDIFRRIIVETIGGIMVLPNKLPISLSNEVPSIDLKMPEPEGVLRIHVVEAKDLMKKDISVLGKGKSDPYAIVTVGSQQFKTQIIESTVNPKWDYWCEAIIQAEVGQYVQINLFDKDDASDDEILGRATVEINSVVKTGSLDTWIALEAAKHGMLHVRLTWFELTAKNENSLDYLQAALNETQMLRVKNMSSAILIVYLDSAINLPKARVQSKPDPYVILSVGKHNKQSSALKRTDAPVWEEGFTFLVGNPANETFQLRIVDQKTDKELGQLAYVMNSLLTKPNMQFQLQPFQLQKSGPTSKVTISLAMKILKKSAIQSIESVVLHRDPDVPNVQSQQSIQSQAENPMVFDLKSVKLAEYPSEPAVLEATELIGQELVTSAAEQLISSEKTNSLDRTDRQSIRHRSLSSQSSMASPSLGRIQIALQYSDDRQRLSVTVHKIINIPLKDPSNVPDPYVKLYLLPGRSKDTKRKTIMVKDNCNPVYDATFEYIISAVELNYSELEVTVATQKGFLSGGSPVIGMVKISLNDPDIVAEGINRFYDLLAESKFE